MFYIQSQIVLSVTPVKHWNNPVDFSAVIPDGVRAQFDPHYYIHFLCIERIQKDSMAATGDEVYSDSGILGSPFSSSLSIPIHLSQGELRQKHWLYL